MLLEVIRHLWTVFKRKDVESQTKDLEETETMQKDKNLARTQNFTILEIGDDIPINQNEKLQKRNKLNKRKFWEFKKNDRNEKLLKDFDDKVEEISKIVDQITEIENRRKKAN